MRFTTFIRRFYPYLKPFWLRFIISSLMMVIIAMTVVAQPHLIGSITDLVFLNDIEAREKSTALLYTLLLLSLFIVYALANAITSIINTAISGRIIMQLRNEMFERLLHLPHAFFDHNTSGRLLSKFIYDVEQIASTAASLWITIIRDGLIVLGLLVYLLFINWQMSMAIFIMLPLILWVFKKAAARLKILSTGLQQSMAELSHALDENITHQSLVKIYNNGKQQKKRIEAITKIIRHKTFKTATTSSANNSLIYIVIGVALSLSIYAGSIIFEMTAGHFIAFFASFSMLISPSKALSNINRPIQRATAAASSIFALLDEKNEVNTGKETLKNCQGNIEFNNVSFAYDDTNALDNINLNINAGETVALVGMTGSGKSTLVQLLCRFYQPQNGNIKIDGIDINNIDIYALRQQIAFVDQKTALFDDTIAANITFGQNNLSLEQIKVAANAASATNFIEKLSAQFNSQIGQDGVRLSGGQRQRLSIARAIAKNASILILDEATAALDSSTEKKVQNAIDTARKNCTTLVIAHRLSTIEKADKIVVMHQGSIVEQGTHKQLLEQKGHYFLLHQSQFK